MITRRAPRRNDRSILAGRNGRRPGLRTMLLVLAGCVTAAIAAPAWCGPQQGDTDAAASDTTVAASPFRLPTDLPMRLVPAYRTLDVLLIQKEIPLDAEQLR
ncbi:MAG: hypothetical protein KC983_07485, partial [Phycisphaerales bacterium]|nr:hypothetical protein [Phycisphaerales bacterium]